MRYLLLIMVLALSFATISSLETISAQGPPNGCDRQVVGPNCGPPSQKICHEDCADFYFDCIVGDGTLIDQCVDDLQSCNELCNTP